MKKGESFVKKKKIFMVFVMILSLVCGSLTKLSAYAGADSVRSRGNIVLDGGKMSIYASDLDYLQSEVQVLYGELPSIIEIDASAAETARRTDIHSKGIINYGNDAVVLDSSDFILLANEIDKLEFEYKANTVAALNGINTYFKPDGSITHDEQEEDILLPRDAAGLSFDVIRRGILRSQSVDHLSVTPAAENNISAGTAAWVDGQCIIGNGKDVQEAYDRGYNDGSNDGYERGKSDGYTQGYEQGDHDGYKRGYADGKADAAPGEAHIEYTYHIHDGVSTQAGGCYIESKSPCIGRMTATDTGTLIPEMGEANGIGFYRYGRKCDVCGYTDTSISNGIPYVGQIIGPCSQYKTTIVLNCGKTEETIETATIYYD